MDVLINAEEEATFLFDRTVNCIMCNKDFKVKAVRAGRGRKVDNDIDLRPIYDDVDVTKYEIVMCPHCGYAANNKRFSNIPEQQYNNVKSQICRRYIPKNEEAGDIYTYPQAIERYKMALLVGSVRGLNTGEMGYLALKMAWLYRAWKNQLELKQNPNNKSLINKCNVEEKRYISNAYNYIVDGFSSSGTVVEELSGPTLNYVIAALAYLCEDYKSIRFHIEKVIISKAATTKLKEMASELRERIKGKLIIEE